MTPLFRSTEETHGKVGIGTRISFGNQQFMIVADGDMIVALLDEKSFKIVNSEQVNDVTWLTRDEFEDLVQYLTCTVTDFTFENVGS